MIAGIKVDCEMVSLREKRTGRKVKESTYTVRVADHHIFTVDNFTPEGETNV